MYANIREKKDMIVRIDDNLTIKSNLKLFFKKKFENIKYALANIANISETKPISELISIFYSNILNFLKLIL